MEAVIYSITTNDGLYIGSTTHFKNRCYRHTACLKSGEQISLLYENIRKNNGQYKIEIILELVCEDKLELRQIEEEYRILCGANLNERLAYRSINQMRIKHMEHYYKHREAIIKKKAEKIDCGCGKKYTRNHRARHYQSKKHQAYLASL